MKLRTCKECGREFESARFRATCSAPCARERRLRQYREAAANRSPESKAKDKIRCSDPEYRNRHAEYERAAAPRRRVLPRGRQPKIALDGDYIIVGKQMVRRDHLLEALRSLEVLP